MSASFCIVEELWLRSDLGLCSCRFAFATGKIVAAATLSHRNIRSGRV